MCPIQNLKITFDRVFDIVGGFGRFQWLLLGMLALQANIFTWHQIGHGLRNIDFQRHHVPPHWCHVRELQHSNWSKYQIKMISIPQYSDYNESCLYNDVDYRSLISSFKSFEAAYHNINFANVSTKKCNEWEYEYDVDWVVTKVQKHLCERGNNLASIIGAEYLVGQNLGTLIFAILADRFLGRRNAMLVTIALVIIIGIAGSLVPLTKSFSLLLICRFVTSLAVGGSIPILNLIFVLENTDIKHRVVATMLCNALQGLGALTLPALTYGDENWSSCNLKINLSTIFLLLPFFWILPDSPRWLFATRRDYKMILALKKISYLNKKAVFQTERLVHEVVEDCRSPANAVTCREGTEVDLTRQNPTEYSLKVSSPPVIWSICNLSVVSSPEIRRRSCLLCVLFFTMSLCKSFKIPTSVFTDEPVAYNTTDLFTSAGGCIVAIIFVNKNGRIITLRWIFILLGISVFGICFSKLGDVFILVMIFHVCVNLLTSAGISTLYLLGAELFPTTSRATCLAIVTLVGSLVKDITEQIIALQITAYINFTTITALIGGGFAIVSSFIVVNLPETKNTDLTDDEKEFI